jgi:hypothetical protein
MAAYQADRHRGLAVLVRSYQSFLALRFFIVRRGVGF